jgi:hypothetical protein
MSQNLSAGKEVLSYCGKCQLKLAHVIMSMKDAVTPHKVQCKTCNGTHSYKAQATSTATKGSSPRSKSALVTKSAEQLWNEAMRIHGNRDKKEYTIRAKFLIGDYIVHPSFGEGFVQANLSNDRIEVLFRNDIKNLVHGKS